MLVNAADMLKKAEAGKYGLGAFNTNNLEWTLAILQAAEEAKSPLILQCTAGARSEEHTSNSSHNRESRMPSSA